MDSWLKKHAKHITNIIRLAILAAIAFCIFGYLRAPNWATYGFTIIIIYLHLILLNIFSLTLSLKQNQDE